MNCDIPTTPSTPHPPPPHRRCPAGTRQRWRACARWWPTTSTRRWWTACGATSRSTAARRRRRSRPLLATRASSACRWGGEGGDRQGGCLCRTRRLTGGPGARSVPQAGGAAMAPAGSGWPLLSYRRLCRRRTPTPSTLWTWTRMARPPSCWTRLCRCGRGPGPVPSAASASAGQRCRLPGEKGKLEWSGAYGTEATPAEAEAPRRLPASLRCLPAPPGSRPDGGLAGECGAARRCRRCPRAACCW